MNKSKRTTSKDKGTPNVKEAFGLSGEKSKLLGMTPNSPFVITTTKERNTREGDEICKVTGAPIIAFEEATGETYCEKCIYDGRAKRPVFMATVAR